MSWFSRLIVPSFPTYPGPYPVGSVDVEIPVADLEAGIDRPTGSTDTVLFRIFYPADSPSANATAARPVRWVSKPQKAHLAAYAQFAGAGSALASIFSNFSRLLNYTSLPVLRNAPLRTTDRPSGRWPVMMFHHGLGGSRNAYSWLVGAVASHGVVLIVPEHRDKSCPTTFIRSVDGATESSQIGYHRMPHTYTEEILAARDAQLRIRLWETRLIFRAIERMNDGQHGRLRNLDANSPSGRATDRYEIDVMFQNQLDLRPGKVIWSGHSFGAVTVVQLVKSVYWQRCDQSYKQDDSYFPLISVPEDESLSSQVTESSPVVILDLWTAPLRSIPTKWLWEKPLPTYSGPLAGKNVLSIMSNTFVDFADVSRYTRRVLSAQPSTADLEFGSGPGPHAYYVQRSAHLSQSDFGILFSWTTSMVLKTLDPEYILKLNTRAICQFLRQLDVDVAGPTRDDFSLQARPLPQDSPVPVENILNPGAGEKTDGWLQFDLHQTSSRPGSKNSSQEKSSGLDPTPVPAKV